MPEYIEKFFVEAYRSFGGTITPVKDRKGVWSISRVPPDLRKLPEAMERRYGKTVIVLPIARDEFTDRYRDCLKAGLRPYHREVKTGVL